MRLLLVMPNVVAGSPILIILMMQAPSSSETSVLTGAKRRNIPEDGIFHNHRRDDLKFYTAKFVPNSPILVTVDTGDTFL
jgi:hypothetical protein